MNSADRNSRNKRRETTLAVSLIFFFVALLCAALRWADGMRHDSRILHIPATGGWLLAATGFAVLGVLFLAWSRNVPESGRGDGR
jgi:hypothetical protein